MKDPDVPEEKLLWHWPETGTMEVSFPEPLSATVRYFPSVDAICDACDRIGVRTAKRENIPQIPSQEP